MAQLELKFQKDLIYSARREDCLAESTTDRFRKGRPDIIIKPRLLPAAYIECKYEVKRKTLNYVPVGTTELQKHCLTTMRNFRMMAFILVCVEIDKKDVRCYPVYDISRDGLLLTEHHYQPEGKEKGHYIWPMMQMIVHAYHYPQMFP